MILPVDRRAASQRAKARDALAGWRMRREKTVDAAYVERVDDEHVCCRRVVFGLVIVDRLGAVLQLCQSIGEPKRLPADFRAAWVRATTLRRAGSACVLPRSGHQDHGRVPCWKSKDW